MRLSRVKVAELRRALLTRLRAHGLKDVPIAVAKKHPGFFAVRCGMFPAAWAVVAFSDHGHCSFPVPAGESAPPACALSCGNSDR